MNNVDQMERYASAIAKVHSEKGQIAFIATTHDQDGDYGPGLAVAVANENGFYPIPKFYYSNDSHRAAEDRADEINDKFLSITPKRAMEIQCSTMGGARA